MFYYASEFDQLKDFDAGVSFALDVGIEAALFFLTGGLSQFRHLRHLKYATKFNQARKGLLAIETEVLVWKGLNITAEGISVSAGLLNSTFDYISIISNDPQTKELAQKLSLLFLGLTITSAGASIYTDLKVVAAAEDVLSETRKLAGSGVDLDPSGNYNINEIIGECERIVETVRIPQVASVAATIEDLSLDHVHVKLLFNSLNEAEKFAFASVFSKIEKLPDADKSSIWNILNRNNGEFINEWMEVKPSHNWVSFKKTAEDEDFMSHFFEGEVKWTLKKEVDYRGQRISIEEVPPEDITIRMKRFKSNGLHHIENLYENASYPDYFFTKPLVQNETGELVFQEGTFRIRKDAIPPEGGYFSAKVDGYFNELLNSGNGGWKSKDQASSFFPLEHTRFQSILKISQARGNRKRIFNPKYETTNFYLGRSDEGLVYFTADDVSAFPYLVEDKLDFTIWEDFKNSDWSDRRDIIKTQYDLDVLGQNIEWGEIVAKQNIKIATSRNVILINFLNELNWVRPLTALVTRIDQIMDLNEGTMTYEANSIIVDITSVESVLIYFGDPITETILPTQDFRDILVIWGEFLTNNPQ